MMLAKLDEMKKDRLLVVDDEADICGFIQDVAEPMGYDVTAVHDGTAFRQAFEQISPTFVTVDLKLPGEDGVELLRFLGDQKCEVPVLLISGFDHRTLATAQRLGATYGLTVVGALGHILIKRIPFFGNA